MTSTKPPRILKPVSGINMSGFRRDDAFIFSKDIKDWQTSRKTVSKNKANKKRLEK